MPTGNNKQTLAERLLRYSTIASVATSGALLAGAPYALTAGTSRTLDCVMDAAGESCDIDFDNDGNPEFHIYLNSSYASDLWMDTRSGGGDAGLSFVWSGLTYIELAVLSFGSTIFAARTDWTSSWYAVFWTSLGGGNWGAPQGHVTDPTQGAYAGVSFTLDGGGTHYGWIELYIPSNNNVTVRRIGYDTTVGTSIPTAVEMSGIESASGLRAAGAATFAALAGLFSWLRRKVSRA